MQAIWNKCLTKLWADPHYSSEWLRVINEMEMNTSKIISRQKVRHMQHHIVDGYISSQQGINALYKRKLIDLKEYMQLMDLNLARFTERLHEWRVTEKMLSIFFAALFSFMAFTANDGDLYRRGRTARKGRRKDTELIE